MTLTDTMTDLRAETARQLYDDWHGHYVPRLRQPQLTPRARARTARRARSSAAASVQARARWVDRVWYNECAELNRHRWR